MKERWSCSEEKLVSAEEGLKPNKSLTRGKTYCCQGFMQYVKLIFLILLIFFIGWSSYIIWKAYNHESIDLYIFESSFTRYRKGELKNSDELSSLALNKSEETLETTTKQYILLKEDVFPSEIYPIDNQLITTMKIPESSIKQDISQTNFENTNAEEPIEDSFKSSINDNDEQMKMTVSSSDKNKTKEDEKSTEESVIEWSFPLIWSIHREEDYLEDIRNAELDAMLKKMDENDEKDERSNEFSKFQEKYFEEEDPSDDQNDENNRSYEKDVPSSIEIFDNLKKLHDSIDAMIKELHVKELNRQSDDDLWQSEESSIKDETSNHLALGLGRQDSIETPPSILEGDSEITKSSLFHDSLIEKDPYGFLLGNHDHSYLESSTLSSLEREDSEKSDTSKVDDARSDLKAGSFESLGWDPSWNSRQGWRKQDGSIETSPTDESTERHIFADVSAAAIEENDDDTIKTFPPWRFYVDPAISSSMENVNSEKEIVFINSRTGDPKESVICTIQMINGLSLLKCSNSFDTESFTEQSNDRPFGSSSYSTADSKSDASTEENDESFPNHYSSFVEADTENSSNDMTTFNKDIDTGDSTIEQEPTEISIDSKNLESEKSDIDTERWMKSESSTDAYFQDNSSEAVEDPVLWWLDVNKYRTKEMSGDETIERKRRGIAKIISGQKTFSDDEDLYGKRMNDETRLHDWIRMHESRILQKMIRKYSNEGLNDNLARFYSEMEILSSHIDMLHELYLRRRNLEDDYISREFLNDSYEN